jgi:Fe-S-cluster containining protein
MIHNFGWEINIAGRNRFRNKKRGRMDLEQRIGILRKIYTIYDEFIKDYDLACKKGCAACCTRNVVLTSLEGYGIIKEIEQENKKDLFEALNVEGKRKRFQPKITINKMADLCTRDEELPREEQANPLWGRCPLLSNKTCPVYENRPFECRSFCSSVNCEEEGEADLDPYIMSVNNVIRQYIEHIDTYGVTGNLTDMLLYLGETENKEIHRKNNDAIDKDLINNSPASILMIPPEHREKIQDLITTLQSIELD